MARMLTNVLNESFSRIHQISVIRKNFVKDTLVHSLLILNNSTKIHELF